MLFMVGCYYEEERFHCSIPIPGSHKLWKWERALNLVPIISLQKLKFKIPNCRHGLQNQHDICGKLTACQRCMADSKIRFSLLSFLSLLFSTFSLFYYSLQSTKNSHIMQLRILFSIRNVEIKWKTKKN